MKLKKLVGAVCALTIAVSAFAGLGLQASAADETEDIVAFSQDFTGITPDGATEISTDPADYGFEVTYGAGSNADLVNTVVEDGVLRAYCNKNTNNGARYATATATLQSAIGVGNEVTVKFKWDMGSATGNKSGSHSRVYLADSNSNKIMDLIFIGSLDNGTLKLNDNTIKSGNTTLRETTYTVEAVLDMNIKKITKLVLDKGNDTFDYTISEPIDFMSESATNMSKIAFENSTRQTWQNISSLDDVSITYKEAKVAVESITVNFKKVDGTIVKTIDINAAGKYVDEQFSYVANNYIKGIDNNYYYIAYDELQTKTWSSQNPTHNISLKKDITLSKNTTIDYTVTEAADSDKIVYLAEGEDIFNGGIGTSQNNRYVASGNATAFNQGAKTIYSVPESGKYKITIVSHGSANRKTAIYKTAEIAAKQTAFDATAAIVSLEPTNSAYGYVAVGEADLTKGDTLTIKGFGNSTKYTTENIDYIVIKQMSVVQTSTKYFTATTTPGATFNSVEITASNGSVERKGFKNFDTIISGGGTIGIAITDIPDGVTIKKVTLK